MTETTDAQENQISDERLKAWIDYPKQRVEELREIAQDLQLDPQQLVFGYAIDVIAQDDRNVFGPTILTFSRESALSSKKQYLGRAAWELSLAELPQEVKDHLREVRRELEGMDWDSQESFNRAYGHWRENVEKWMFSYLNRNEEAKTAYQTYLKTEDRVRRT